MVDFDPCLLNEVIKLSDDILCDLTQNGLYFQGRHKVYLVTERRVGQDEGAGIPGKVVPDKVEVIPPPEIDLRTQFRVINEQTQKVGEAAFKKLSQTYTREDIEGADYFEIDGSAYKLVGGSLKDEAAGVYWSGILERRKGEGRTAP